MKNLIILFFLCFTTQLFAQEIFTPNMLYRNDLKIDTVFITHDSIYCPPKVRLPKVYISPTPCTFTSVPIDTAVTKNTVVPMSVRQFVNLNITTTTPKPTLVIIKDKDIHGIGWMISGFTGMVVSVGCFARANHYDVHIQRLRINNEVWVNGVLVISQQLGKDNTAEELHSLEHYKNNWELGGCISGGIGLGLFTWGTINVFTSANGAGVRINF